MRNKIIRAFALMFLCASHLWAEKQLTIGVIAPLSGDVASWGGDVRNVLLFAKEKLGALNVEFIFEDDQCLGKNAVSAAHKLIDIDRIDFAMVVCTESMLATAPIFEKSKILVIAPVASGAAVSRAGEYIFRIWPSDAKAGKILLDYVAQRHHTFGVLSESRGYAQELADAFFVAADGSSIRVVKEMFNSEETDFRTLLLRLKARKVDGLFVNTNSERAFANVLSQLQQVAFKVPVYGVYMPGNSAFLKIAGNLAEGVVFVDAPSLENNLTPDAKSLYQEYLKQYGPLQSSNFIFASAYEALRRLIALDGKEDKRNELYAGSFSGIFGPYRFDKNGDVVEIKHELRVIMNGLAKPIIVLAPPDNVASKHPT